MNPFNFPRKVNTARPVILRGCPDFARDIYSPGKSSQPTMANRLIESVRNAKDYNGKPAFMPRASDLADDGCNTASRIRGKCAENRRRVKGLSPVGNGTGRILLTP